MLVHKRLTNKNSVHEDINESKRTEVDIGINHNTPNKMPQKTKIESKVSPFRIFLYLSLVGFLTLMLVGYTMLSNDSYDDRDASVPQFKDAHAEENDALRERINDPIILWWTPFTGQPGARRSCGDNYCFFTVDKHYFHHHQTKVMMFYGTDIEMKNLPIPRKPHHEWALLHEESPKNDYTLTHSSFLTLFNHSCTFKRESDFPLTLQYVQSVEWLESNQFLVPTVEKTKLQTDLALVFYTQSDCNVPSDRDSYVQKFMQYMAVDAYGSCLHNKDLPVHLVNPLPGMEHKDFFRIQAKYKFSFAMENAICDDYITEKIWRPLMVGSVPIIYGSPRIKDMLPSNHSAIFVSDFNSPKQLADYLKFLNENDAEYNKFLEWKTTGITNRYLLKLMRERSWSIVDTWKSGNTNYIEDFECFVCTRVHENLKRKKLGEKEILHMVDKSHLECPEPKAFYVTDFDWNYDHQYRGYVAEAVRYFADHNVAYTKGEFNAKVSEMQYNNKKGWF